jgi:hypothetical protein
MTGCFTCATAAAGNQTGGPYSAYCTGCQPRPAAIRLRNLREAQCAVCLRVFSTVTDWDHHQRITDGIAACAEPTSMGLVQDAGRTWGTPEGHANRERLAERMASSNAARSLGRPQAA